jgi:organic hydroperoxide reductase OsmC/OhrA
MPEIAVSLRNVPGTEAAMGWAGGHTLLVDRPEGRAGGMGLGFNGGQMLALAIGGCLCNDLRYVAEAMGVALSAIEVDALLHLEGEPLVAMSADIKVHMESSDPRADLAEVLRRAERDSTVSNSVKTGFPVAIRAV